MKNNNQNYTSSYNRLRALIISGEPIMPMASNKRWEKESEGFKGDADIPRPLEQDTLRKMRAAELRAARASTKKGNQKTPTKDLKKKTF